MRQVRIGTRASKLAMAQTLIVAAAIKAACPDIDVQTVPIVTRGDTRRESSAEFSGKGAFTEALEAALRDGQVDLAVHSAKDLPCVLADDLAILAVPRRADPRDVLVSLAGGSIGDLPRAATVGTSSLRRKAQLLATRADLQVLPIRGNIETRLLRVLGDGAARSGKRAMAAIVLAMAGMERCMLLELYEKHLAPLDVRDFVPAAGQGALAVQSLADNAPIGQLVEAIDHGPSRQALLAERKVLQIMGADCHSCIGVHIYPVGRQWCGLGMIGSGDAQEVLRAATKADSAERAALLMVDEFRRRQGESLLNG